MSSEATSSKTTRSKQQILQADYLPVRAKIIEIAAALDRLELAGGELDDGRFEQLLAALAILQRPSSDGDRAEKIQRLFSRDYSEKWRSEFEI